MAKVSPEIAAAIRDAVLSLPAGTRPNWVRIARDVGCSQNTASKYGRAFVPGLGPAMPPAPGDATWVEDDGGASLERTLDRPVRTLEDVLDVARVDVRVWAVDRYECTPYQSAMKFGKKGGERVVVTQLWRLKVFLRRIAPKPILDALSGLFESMRDQAPPHDPPPVRSRDRPHMLVMDLMDAHFGKLAWAPETGQNFDLKLSSAVYRNAVVDLLDAVGPRSISEIVLPLGNDFCHIDGLDGTTTAGTRVDVDGRPTKIIRTCAEAVIWAVRRLREAAPVRVIWVPGNHDRLISFCIAMMVEAYFHGASDVVVDASPKHRKFVRYGDNLLGFTHGDCEPHRDLPAIMATEEPALWGETRFREWHCGHLHKKKKMTWLDVDTHVGVVVRTLQSLSAVDSWHYQRGYVGTARAAEAYLYRESGGYCGHFNALARE